MEGPGAGRMLSLGGGGEGDMRREDAGVGWTRDWQGGVGREMKLSYNEISHCEVSLVNVLTPHCLPPTVSVTN